MDSHLRRYRLGAAAGIDSDASDRDNVQLNPRNARRSWQKRRKRKQTVAMLALVSLLAFTCSDPEQDSRTLYNRAAEVQRDGRIELAAEMFAEIVREYPQTVAATDANARLDALQLLGIEIPPERDRIFSATVALRTLNFAQASLLAAEGRYAHNLTELYASGLASPEFFQTPGYTLTLAPNDDSYDARATPNDPSGIHLFITADNFVRFAAGRPPGLNDLILGDDGVIQEAQPQQ